LDSTFPGIEEIEEKSKRHHACRSIYAAIVFSFVFVYSASARINPPIIASEPVATWPTAAFFVAEGVGVVVDEACVFAALVLLARVVERVMFELGVEVGAEVVLFETDEVLAT
jgi:hypothetical protein